MTTITALNVRLGMDVSNFSEGANLAKGEVTKVAAIMRQSVPPATKYKQEVDLLNRAFSEAGKKSKEYADALTFLQNKHKQTAAAISATTAETKKAAGANDSALASIKGMAAAYLSFQTVTKSINLASQVEDATIAFEVLTGSAKDGAIIFEQIRKFAAESPVTFSGATQAAKTMMSFGIAAQDVQKNLQMLSDVTGGNNERFKMLALSFSQMSSAGRLMGQDLLQMVNAGFNPLQQISKKTGESLIELKKRMEDGGISADEVRQAFEDATAKGGMFHGMTDRLADTVSGKLNIALSDLEQKLAETGKALGPLIKTLLDAFQKMKPVLDVLVWLIDKISTGLAFISAAVADFSALFRGDFDASNINKFLDELDQADRDRANAANQQNKNDLEQKLDNVNTVAAAERQAAKDAEEAAKAADDAHKKRIAETLRETDELVKQARRDAEQAEKDFQRELESARDDAMRFFEDQRQKNEQRRADVARGPGTGMDAGSAEAVRFAADIVNARIGASAVPDVEVVTQRQIAEKTAELLLEQREANAQQQRQITLAEAQLALMQANGFVRIR